MKYFVFNHNETLIGEFKTRKAAEAEALFYHEQTGNPAFVQPVGDKNTRKSALFGLSMLTPTLGD